MTLIHGARPGIPGCPPRPHPSVISVFSFSSIHNDKDSGPPIGVGDCMCSYGQYLLNLPTEMRQRISEYIYRG